MSSLGGAGRLQAVAGDLGSLGPPSGVQGEAPKALTFLCFFQSTSLYYSEW